MIGLEEILKNKINWKFLNYLKDKATNIEDAGYLIEITISTNKKNSGFITFYMYNKNEEVFIHENIPYVGNISEIHYNIYIHNLMSQGST